MIIIQEKKRSLDVTVLLGWFFIYSFLGWIYETMYCSIKAGHFVNRGFLFGPFIPIYGLSIVVGILLFAERNFNKPTLFLACAFTATALEYLTSLWMELVFGKRWWNYSDEILNINGRVCLGAAVVFGLMGVLIIKYIHPLLIRFINYYLPYGVRKMIVKVSVIVLSCDILMSFARSFT